MTTRFHYEVWASDTGEASHWKHISGGVWVFTKGAAYEMAHAAYNNGKGMQRVCVEAWDDRRNLYLSTVYEFGVDPKMI